MHYGKVSMGGVAFAFHWEFSTLPLIFSASNISDRFVSLPSHFIRVQIFQILLWGTKWTVVNHALFYSRRKVIENMESESEFINRIFGRPAASKKIGEIFVKHFFRLWMQCFPTRWCFSQMFNCIQQYNFFGTHFVCEKHPLHVFFFFPLFECLDLLKLFHLPIFEELRKVHAKNFMFSVKIGREIIF